MLLVSCSAAGAAWTASGGGPARTNSTPERGPAFPDVAFTLQLDENVTAQPLILDGRAFIGTGHPALFDGSILTIDLARGTSSPFAQTRGAVSDMTTDGIRLFVASVTGDTAGGAAVAEVGSTGVGLASYALDRGTVLWEQPFLLPPRDTATNLWATDAVQIAQRDGIVYIAGSQWSSAVGYCYYCDWRVFAAAYDATDGGLKWSWFQDNIDRATDGEPAQPSVPKGGLLPNEGFGSGFAGFTLFGSQLVVASSEVSTSLDQENALYGLSSVTGALQWATRGPSLPNTPTADAPLGVMGVTAANPVAHEGILYAKLDDLFVLDLGTGEPQSRVPVPRDAQQASSPPHPSRLAFDGHTLVTTTATRLVGFNETTKTSWALSSDSPTAFLDSDLVMAAGTVFVGAASEPWNGDERATADGYLLQVDSVTGSLGWVYTIPKQPNPGYGVKLAVSNGTLVGAFGRSVVVLGQTPASIEPVVALDAAYPAPGQTIQMDLSGSKPGIHGAPTLFSVEWGDGTTSSLQQGPTFAHSYAKEGHFVVRAHLANSAGQSTTASAAIGVGQTDPAITARLEEQLRLAQENATKLQNDLDARGDLNPLQTAFSPEHQNVMFFVLGLAVSAVGVLLGFLRVQRRRRLLKREVAALRAAHEAASTQPQREMVLADFRARGRLLLSDGKIDHAQFVVLTQTIDDLERRTRAGGLALDLGFLPKAFRRQVALMMADGRIRRGELSRFDALLADDTTLGSVDRARAHDTLTRWSTQDSVRP